MEETGGSASGAHKASRAQSGMELLIILAVGLVVLGFVITTSQDRLNSSQQVLALSVAKTSVNDLAAAADAVYYEGLGAKRQVRFTIPEGTVATSVTANSINIRIRIQQGNDDAFAITHASICLNSKLPGRAGTYTTTVESTDGCVLIGGGSNLTVSTTLLLVAAYPNTTAIRSVNYSNTGASQINVNLNLNFPYAQVPAAFVNPSDASFTLAAGASKEVQLRFAASESAQGSYSGSIAAYGSNGENVSTSIIVNIASQTCQQQTCTVGTTGSNVSLIEIMTYSSGSYNQIKEIFDPSELILVSGGNWDPNSAITLDVRDPTDSFSLQGYPKSLTANSSGGFSDSLPAAGLNGLNGYIVRTTGTEGGKSRVKTTNFDINVCT